MPEIPQIVDIHGTVRRLGSLAPDEGMVRAFRTMATTAQEWTDAEIRRVITDPDHPDSRELFGDDWICDQGSYGSCNGWATAEAIARARWLRGIRDGITKLSGSFIYAHINDGRDQGSALSRGLLAAEQFGAPPASMVPADKIYLNQIPASATTEAAKHKGFLGVPLKNLQQLKTALAQKHPCIVALQAGSNYQRLDANGISGVDNGSGNHAVVTDGLRYINGKFYPDHAGSWGLRAFNRGRSLLRLEALTQTIGIHLFWALRSTEEAG